MKKTVFTVIMIIGMAVTHAQIQQDSAPTAPYPASIKTDTVKVKSYPPVKKKESPKDITNKLQRVDQKRAKFSAANNTDTGKADSKKQAQKTFMELGFPVWRLFFTLVILVGLIIGCMYLIKHFTKRFGAIQSDTNIDIITKLQIDPKNSLLLIRVYEQEMLLGVGSERISMLSKFHSITNSELDDDDIESDVNNTTVAKNDFSLDSPDVILDIKNLNSLGDQK